MNRELNSKHFYNLNREKRRELKAIWIQNEINNLDISKIHQPTGKPGKVIIFRNNLIHKGVFVKKENTGMLLFFISILQIRNWIGIN